MEFTVQLATNASHVIIERNAHHHLCDYLDVHAKIMVISDDHIPASLKKVIMDQLDHAVLVEVAEGEGSKSIETYHMLLEKLLEHDFSRKDIVLALGGGVIGDLSGFVASTYKRGCRFISIPTTTLAQIDSSIGGKVAINMNNIKNCVGNFYHPEQVIVDITTLKTLPKRHFYNGLVEALKAGVIQDPILFDLFKQHVDELDVDSPYLEEIIERSLLIKKNVVEKDEKEQHLRKILNFGHTIGHAIESLYHLHDYYHGECVANGMLRIMDNETIYMDLKDILAKMHIPFIHHLDEEACIRFIQQDKKAMGHDIDVVVVHTLGEACIEKVAIDTLRPYLRRSL